MRCTDPLGVDFSPLRQGCSPPDLPQHYSRGNAPRLYWRAFFPPCLPTIPPSSPPSFLFPFRSISLPPHRSVLSSLSRDFPLRQYSIPLFNSRIHSLFSLLHLSSSTHAVYLRGLSSSALLYLSHAYVRSVSFSLSLPQTILLALFLSVFASMLFFFRTYISLSVNRYPSCSLTRCSSLVHKSKAPW